MTTLVEQLAVYGARDAVRELPPEVMHHAKRAVIDWFSALYPGTRMDPARLLVAAHREELGVGRSSLPGFGTTAFPALAAWINGSASHSPEFDDIFRDGIYHPGCPVVAAALAVAEDRNRTGTEMLRAVVVGYEISTRIAASVQPSHYDFFHTTGTAGVFGAAAAAACLYAPGDAKVLKDALGTAGTFASGLQQAFRSDTMTKPLHAGHAAQVGVLAAQSAAAGVTGAADILEGEAGFGHALSKAPKFEKVTAGLGERYNITQMTQKNHGCCGHAFAAIDAVLAIMQKGVRKDDVARIEVDGYKATVEVAGIMDPQGAAEAKFSTPYVLAHALKYGSVRLDAYEPHKLADAELRNLLRRVTLREDPKLTAAFPGQRSARVAITTKDGQRHEHFSPTRKGDPDDPLTDADLDAKFLELAGPVIGEDAAAMLLRRLWTLESATVGAGDREACASVIESFSWELRMGVNQLAADPAVKFDHDIAEQYLRYARMLSARGYVASSTGNVVMRVPHANYPDGVCYVKCMGVSLEEMTADDIVITDVLEGLILHGARATNVGHQLNREILRLRPDVNAVIHLHHDETIAFFAAGYEKLNITGLTFPYLMQSYPHYLAAHINVEEDVAPVKTFIQGTNCIIMKRHGFTVLGRTLSECYGRTNVLVGEVKRNIIAEQLAALHGRKPEYLEAAEIETMFKEGNAVMYPEPKR